MTDFLEAIRRWRALPEAEKKARRLESIPLSVARSMAFEGDPVPAEWLAKQQRYFDTLARAVRSEAGLIDAKRPSLADDDQGGPRS